MRTILFFTLFLIISVIASGCLGTKYLKEDEKLLYKQKIKGSEDVNKDDLSQLLVQKANRQFPLISVSPYVWFYYYGFKRYDLNELEEKRKIIKVKWNEKIAEAKEKPRKKASLERKKAKKIEKINKVILEGNVYMRWGEPIAVYDSTRTGLSMGRLQLYLNSKGYFKAKVDTSLNISGKKVSITYNINQGPAYVIDSLLVEAGDNFINNILNKNKDDSFLLVGENYDQSNITKERERIDLLLKDNGYFDFSRQYVEFNVDTAYNGKEKIGIQTIINKPSKRGYHKIFTIDSINFTTDSNIGTLADSLRKEENYRGITFRSYSDEYNKKILSSRVFIKKDSTYSKTDSYNTQRQLANLDHFRFININYDSLGGRLIANIFTSPLNRYQWSNEVGVNVTQGFPGPFYNLSFKKRNVFRGLEIFEINGRIGIEGVAPATDVQDVYASIEAGTNATLTFPKFVFPLTSALKERFARLNPKTRLLAGYTYTKRPEYTRQNLNFSNTYTWQKVNRTLFSFTATDISIINSDLALGFLDNLEVLAKNGNRLINTFRPSFVSSMSFSSTWNFNGYGLNFRNSSFMRLYLESGGTTLNFGGTELLEEKNLEYYKYLKVNADYRKIHPINEGATLAYRINTGVAKPYSDNNILPYEKYFFAGGSNGIRAWRPRRLGPGSFIRIDTVTNRVNYNFEQQGEILLEASIELRMNLIGFIDYAFFIDAGNVWTITEDPSRPGAQFEFDRFYKEIAIGAGLGLRFDFSFLILRLDAGLKVYDPARPETSRFILSDKFYDAPFTPKAAESVVFNIGIGYPF